MKQKTIITISTEAHSIDGNRFLLFKDKQGVFVKDRMFRPTLEHLLISQLRIYGLDTVIILTVSTTGKSLSKMLVLEQDNTYSTFCGNAAKLIGTFLPKMSGLQLETITNQQVEISKSSHVEVSLPIEFLTIASAQNTVITNNFAPIMNIENIQLFTAAGEPHLVIRANVHEKTSFANIKKACLGIQPLFALIGGINVCVVRDTTKPLVTVFERGVNNFTQSCGTGAASIAASLRNPVDKIHFIHPEGSQHIKVRKDSSKKVALLGKEESIALFSQQIHLTDSGIGYVSKQKEEVML